MRILENIKVLIIATTILLIQPQVAYAGFDQLVKDVFPSGTMSNVTRSAIVKEQAAGHLMGGSVTIKAPADPPLRPFHAQAPSCKLGGLPCGAQFELFGGAVSMVSGKELMEHLKTLPQSAATYGAMMAIKSLCPQCQDLLEYLDSKADWLNQMSFDKCEAVQSLMDPVLAKVEAKSQAMRQSAMVLDGSKRDMSEIQSKSKKNTGDPSKNDPKFKSQLGENYNLVWKALATKTGMTEQSKAWKELLMSISGTIIGTIDEERISSVTPKKSLVNKDLIKQFVGANGIDSQAVNLYICDESERCLKPNEKKHNIVHGAFLYNRVRGLLSSIVEKIYTNSGELDVDEETLVALSSEQLILKIEMDLAKYSDRKNVIDNQSEFIEALCYDVITSYLQSLLQEVQEAVGKLSHKQISDAEKFKEFEQETREIMRMLSAARMESRARYDVIAASKYRLRMDIDHFAKDFESYLGMHKSN